MFQSTNQQFFLCVCFFLRISADPPQLIQSQATDPSGQRLEVMLPNVFRLLCRKATLDYHGTTPISAVALSAFVHVCSGKSFTDSIGRSILDVLGIPHAVKLPEIRGIIWEKQQVVLDPMVMNQPKTSFGCVITPFFCVSKPIVLGVHDQCIVVDTQLKYWKNSDAYSL